MDATSADHVCPATTAPGRVPDGESPGRPPGSEDRAAGRRDALHPGGQGQVARKHKLQAVPPDPGRLRPDAGRAGRRLRDVPHAVRGQRSGLHRPRPQLLRGREAVVRPVRARLLSCGATSRSATSSGRRHGPRVPGKDSDPPASAARGSSPEGYLGRAAPDAVHQVRLCYPDGPRPVPVMIASNVFTFLDGQQVLKHEFSNVGSICLQNGMQKVRVRISLAPPENEGETSDQERPGRRGAPHMRLNGL